MLKQLIPLTRLLHPILLFLMAALTQLTGLPGDFVMDDLRLVSSAGFASAEWLGRVWLGQPTDGIYHYYPLSQTLLALQFKLFGPAPAAFKAISIFLHAANTVLLHRILRAYRFEGAFWGCLLFALHPLQAQTVQWIIEQNTLLSFFLAALALLAVIHKRPLTGLAFFWAALLSKVLAVFAIVPLLLSFYRTNTKAPRHHYFPALYTALALFWALLALHREAGLIDPALSTGSGMEALAAKAVFIWNNAGHYASKILFPNQLAFFYPQPHSPAAAGNLWIGLTTAVALLGAAIFLDRKGARIYLSSILLAALWLTPVMGWIPMSYHRLAPAADHFCYWPVAALAPAAGRIFFCLQALISGRSILLVFFLPILTAVAAASASRFADADRLWADTLRKNPTSAMAHHERGLYLAAKGQYREAKAELFSALQQDPGMDLALVNLGNLAAKEGDFDRALRFYRAALRINSSRWQAKRNLERLTRRVKDTTNPDSAL